LAIVKKADAFREGGQPGTHGEQEASTMPIGFPGRTPRVNGCNKFCKEVSTKDYPGICQSKDRHDQEGYDGLRKEANAQE